MSNEVNKVNEVSYWGTVVVTEVILFFVNEVKMRFSTTNCCAILRKILV